MPTKSARLEFDQHDLDLLERRLEEALECTYNEFFEDASAEKTLVTAYLSASGTRFDPIVMVEAEFDEDDETDTTNVRLTAEQEKTLFLRLNYIRFRLIELLEPLGAKAMSASAARNVIRWEKLNQQTRDEIVQHNVPLVLAMAKRTKLTGLDYAELISEGNLALLRSVEKFDCSRGFKFSTYACRAILKSFSRVATRTARYRGYFPTEFDPSYEKGDYLEQRRREHELTCVDELKSILGRNLAHLSDVEHRVIQARFALDGEPSDRTAMKAQTLEQVGEMIGVTKERVRQIQNKALDKLKTAMERGMTPV